MKQAHKAENEKRTSNGLEKHAQVEESLRAEANHGVHGEGDCRRELVSLEIIAIHYKHSQPNESGSNRNQLLQAAQWKSIRQSSEKSKRGDGPSHGESGHMRTRQVRGFVQSEPPHLGENVIGEDIIHPMETIRRTHWKK